MNEATTFGFFFHLYIVVLLKSATEIIVHLLIMLIIGTVFPVLIVGTVTHSHIHVRRILLVTGGLSLPSRRHLSRHNLWRGTKPVSKTSSILYSSTQKPSAEVIIAIILIHHHVLILHFPMRLLQPSPNPHPNQKPSPPLHNTLHPPPLLLPSNSFHHPLPHFQ